MPFPKTLSFFLGVLLGAAGFFWIATGGIAPPEPQDTKQIDVIVGKLKPKDQWLEKVRFQIVPLDSVLSLRTYAVLLMIPPPGGVPVSAPTASTELNLTTSASGTIQPIGIARGDFGPNGDQVVVKFIDAECTAHKYYEPNQHYWLASAPFD